MAAGSVGRGELGRIRTLNLLIRSQVLYPVELLVRVLCCFSTPGSGLKSRCKFNDKDKLEQHFLMNSYI